MLDIGRVCVKIAGREAGKYCVVIDKISDGFVLVDGNIKRRKCNILHLEPTDKALNIKKGADTKTVVGLMKKEGIIFKEEPKFKRKEKEAKEIKKEVPEKEKTKKRVKESKKTKEKEK